MVLLVWCVVVLVGCNCLVAVLLLCCAVVVLCCCCLVVLAVLVVLVRWWCFVASLCNYLVVLVFV